MVREIDVSRMTIRMRQKGGDKDEERVYAKLVGQTLDVLKRHLVHSLLFL